MGLKSKLIYEAGMHYEYIGACAIPNQYQMSTDGDFMSV
jgi:hypothetical protein